MSLTLKLTAIASSLISTLGYGGLAFGLVVDSAGVPIPSEVLLPLAGALAKQGRFNFVAVVVVATVAQTIGALLAYELGAKGGLPLLKKYGKYVLFSEHELNKTQRLFARHGSWLTFFGRCLPGIRTYIGYPAGLARMPRGPFLLASLVGSLFWSLILTALGYKLSDNLTVIDQGLHRFGLVVLLLVIAALGWYIWHRRQSEPV